MGKTDDGVATPGVPDAGGSDASASAEQPLGKLWSWTPETETVAVGPKTEVLPASSSDVEPVETPAAAPLRKRWKRKSKKDAPAAEATAAPEPVQEPVAAPAGAQVGKLWNWTPEEDSPAVEAPPRAEPVAEEAPVSDPVPASEPPAAPVGKLWNRKPKDSPVAEAPRAEPVVEAIPEPEPVQEPVSAPLTAPVGKLWNWTPETDSPAADVSLADRVAEVVREVEAASGITTSTDPSAGVLWSWTPPTDVEPVETPPTPPPDVEPVETPPAPAPVPPPDVELVETPPDPERTTVRPILSLDSELVLPSPPFLAPPIYVDPPEGEPWAVIPPPRVEGRRGVRLALGVLVVAVCAALPWVVPQIPDLFAEAVPEQVSTPPNHDLPIGPPPASPTKVDDSLSGKRLASVGTPLEVTVERLHVHSGVVPISGASGELIPPDDPKILGWWQEGRGVGTATGSAVVTGHTVSGGGGAFDHLGELVPGDQINVRTKAGTIEYVVRESHDVSVEELARTAESIFKQTGPGRLVLITCSDFNGTVYLSNSVVYASPVADKPVAKR